MTGPPSTCDSEITWSASAVQQILRDCSLQFFLQRLRALEPERLSASSSLGTAVHDAHAFARAQQRAGREVVLADLIEVFYASWETACQDERLSFPKGKDAANLAEQGRKLVEVMAGNLGHAEVIGVEQEFAVPITLPNGEIRTLTGIFDVVVRHSDGSVVVLDLKTASTSYSDLQVEQSIQATAYLYAARALYGSDVEMGFAVVTKTRQPKYQEIYAHRDETDFVRLAALIQIAETMVEQGVFYPQESWLCVGCGYRSACSEWAARRLPLARASA